MHDHDGFSISSDDNPTSLHFHLRTRLRMLAWVETRCECPVAVCRSDVCRLFCHRYYGRWNREGISKDGLGVSYAAFLFPDRHCILGPCTRLLLNLSTRQRSSMAKSNGDNSLAWVAVALIWFGLYSSIFGRGCYQRSAYRTGCGCNVFTWNAYDQYQYNQGRRP